ncbi:MULTISPECIES: protein translocase subunit SecF [unclassified Pseudoxanthomonas]|uniref:protein translocase subunit SecF n=1 Tax=unclassified Pseudoxanthomonas TaxID=2645906 RepID=UPI00307DC5F6
MSLFPLRLIPNTTNFNFMRVRWVSIAIAALLTVAAIGAMAFKGFNFALDFTGGTVVELRFQTPPDVEGVRSRLDAGGYGSAQVQTFGSGSDLLVRLQPREVASSSGTGEAGNSTADDVLRLASTESNAAKVMRSEFVGPQVGKELAEKAALTLACVLVGFLIYIGVRFEWKFAISAIVTTLSDVVIVAGFFAVSGVEFDLTILAGLLSVMGFSINDKIVVFDRVRENFRNLRAEPMEILNRSINQTLSRTIITSFVAFLTVFALYLYGGGSLEGMALSQMIGIVLGTISSIFVACPLLTIGFLTVTKQDLMPKAKDEALLARRP